VVECIRRVTYLDCPGDVRQLQVCAAVLYLNEFEVLKQRKRVVLVILDKAVGVGNSLVGLDVSTICTIYVTLGPCISDRSDLVDCALQSRPSRQPILSLENSIWWNLTEELEKIAGRVQQLPSRGCGGMLSFGVPST
jgi:hypothetical protein